MLISSGPTREPLDPVRYLSNYSTGMMGAALAGEAARRGHRVTVVSGPASAPLPGEVRIVRVERTAQMRAAMQRLARGADIVVMAAAVADYQPVRVSRVKLARGGRLLLRLKATPDIVSSLPRHRGQIVAGFALETARVLERAAQKLRRKRLDLIVAQDAAHELPFGRRSLHAVLLDAAGGRRPLGRISKAKLAAVLLDKAEALWYGGKLVRQPFVHQRDGARQTGHARMVRRGRNAEFLAAAGALTRTRVSRRSAAVSMGMTRKAR